MEKRGDLLNYGRLKTLQAGPWPWPSNYISVQQVEVLPLLCPRACLSWSLALF